MSDNEHTLFCVTMKVRPLPWHPKFYEWQFGYLEVWLFSGSNGGDVAKRARKIVVENLPYELVGDEVAIRENASSLEGVPSGEAAAMAVGLGIFLACVPTGTDEGDFEREDFPPPRGNGPEKQGNALE